MMEHDMREKAKNAMRLILEAARFEVEEVDEPLDLSAVRDGDCLLVLCSNDADLIGQFDKTNYSLMVDDHEMTCKKLLFTLEKDIVTENCTQWGIDEFVQYAGEAVLADIVARELTLDLPRARRRQEGRRCRIGGRVRWGTGNSRRRRARRYFTPPFPGQTFRAGRHPHRGYPGCGKTPVHALLPDPLRELRRAGV